MRFSLKTSLAVVALAALASLIGTWVLRSTASDFWGYGNYGVGGGAITSPVYYIEARGVGSTPTFARVVRFSDHSAAPTNAFLVGHGVSAEIQANVQNTDRWNGGFTLIAGRTLEEKVSITLDHRTANGLFAKPGTQTKDYRACAKLWDEHIAPHLASKPEN